MTSAIVTMPPYAPYLREVLSHPFVSGVRLNTVMPLTESVDSVVRRLQGEVENYGKLLWIDLKGRQLRVKNFGVPPFTEIELTHKIYVDTPVKAYFCDGNEEATVLKVDGNRLIMQEGPRKVIGPGESLNIPHPSLRIEGYFTDLDKQYISAGMKAGTKGYMLSFVEGKDDVKEFRTLAPDADLVAKIESQKGLDYVRNQYSGETRLMTARGDLFVELKPHHIVRAAEDIVRKDPDAIAASRIFDSLVRSPEPSCADIGDAENLLRMGYKHFMFGDHICLRRESVLSGLNLLEAIADSYERRR